MKSVIEEVIKLLVEKVKYAQSNEALHYTQAALNLAHVLQIVKQAEETK